jgi:hypothetical protein
VVAAVVERLAENHVAGAAGDKQVQSKLVIVKETEK